MSSSSLISSLLFLSLVFLPKLTSGQGCACGQSEFRAKFKISTMYSSHENDKVTFDGPTASKGSPNRRTATYTNPAEFWLIGAPQYPVYTVTVKIGEVDYIPSGGKVINISVP